MSSEANSSASRAAPTSTVVVRGCRESKGSSSVKSDRAVEREKCLWFERKLGMKRYLRDKRIEERHHEGLGDRYVRLNSKILQCSYEVPATELPDFVKRLHKLLSRGLDVRQKKKLATVADRRYSKADARHEETAKDWMCYSDLTVQVFPKFPSVLWFDVECMPCKKGSDGEEPSGTAGGGKRHFDSRAVVKTVAAVVLENAGVYASMEEQCDHTFVTRGKTCGMHMYFPQVRVLSEHDNQELWTAANRRLCESQLRGVVVDTGCSAMPLPLARNHNGLTKIDFEKNEQSGEIEIRPTALWAPTLKELWCFTNFYHLLGTASSSPPSTVVTPSCVSLSSVATATTTALEIRQRRVQPESRGSTNTSRSGSSEIYENDDSKPVQTVGAVESAAVAPEITETEQTMEVEEEEVSTVAPTRALMNETNHCGVDSLPTDTVAPEEMEEVSSVAPTRVLLMNETNHCGVDSLVTDTVAPQQMEVEEESTIAPTRVLLMNETNHSGGDDKNSPSASSTSSTTTTAESSKHRLVQTDIRTMCAGVTDGKRKSSESETGESPKRRRTVETIVADDTVRDENDEDAPRRVLRESSSENCESNERTTSRASSRVAESEVPESLVDERRRDAAETSPLAKTPETRSDFEEETASSLLCAGYVPSVKNSLISSASEKGRSVSSDSVRSDHQPHPSEEENEDESCSVKEMLALVDPFAESAAAFARGGEPSSNLDGDQKLEALYVEDDSTPPNATLPDLWFKKGNAAGRTSRADILYRIARAKEAFEHSMKTNLDAQENQTHETDMQLITSSFNTEMNFYTSILHDSRPITKSGGGYKGLHLKDGCSLQKARENCPTAMFLEHVPFVLYSEDFVTEADWTVVLVRYFDEYLNNAPFLHVMIRVLQSDENVKKSMSEVSRRVIADCLENCYARFRGDRINYQEKKDRQRHVKTSRVPKHHYEDKCTIVIGLVAICSVAFKMITPIFTDMAKICRLVIGDSQQTLELLNTSTMSTTNSESSAYQDDCLFDESVSQVGSDGGEEGGNTVVLDDGESTKRKATDTVAASIGNNHAVLASILRWNYPALADQTLSCLFFYYYHVHADALTRILDEVVHGGLMVTALLQSYFEIYSNSTAIDVHVVCTQSYAIAARLNVTEDGGECDGEDEDRSLMPPPPVSSAKNKKSTARGRGGRGRGGGGNRRASSTSPTRELKRQQFESRNENSKRAQRKFQAAKNGRREECEEDERDRIAKENGNDGGGGKKTYELGTFEDVLCLVVRHYLRPVCFDETTVVYTETGYEQCQNEFATFFSDEREVKRKVMDLFTRSTLKYSMPHGDLLMYNTDVMGTVHRRSSCTNNLVLNMFENMHGGCMSYLTRRYNNHLKIFNQFNGDVYRLVVECRHAMNELVKSIELSYINLILRQPVVPPVLESDISVRHMFMSEEDVLRGAFVCLNPMDYVRSINMFTRHSKFSQDNCKIAESFLDLLITDRDTRSYDGGNDGETRMRFRTVLLFYLLYIFEVLYKIRHAYNRDGSYRVSVERLGWELDVRVLLKLFFGPREFKTPRGLLPDALEKLDLPADLYGDQHESTSHWLDNEEDFASPHGANKTTGTRCINTRPVVSTDLPDKMARMTELFGRKGIVVMKSYAPLMGGTTNNTDVVPHTRNDGSGRGVQQQHGNEEDRITGDSSRGSGDHSNSSCDEQDRRFLDMKQAELEEALYSATKWYDNCRVRVKAVNLESERASRSEKLLNNVDMCMDAVSMDTFLRTQLRVNIDNDRLGHVESAVRERRDFAFCTHLPLRVKMMSLVLATHTVKRLSAEVATDFVRKEYHLERMGVVRFGNKFRNARGGGGEDEEDEAAMDVDLSDELRPDQEWAKRWSILLNKRKYLLTHCRSLAQTHFPDSYFVGLHPDDTYHALYNYMLAKPKYAALRSLQTQTWTKDVCAALNYLLVMNAYDTELVELCLRLFLGFEWPGQWAKRIFVWKSNSNAGKSFFFEHIIRKAFDNSTCINDPKGGKENAPEKSEYYKNFVLMINEFSSASASELKKLCSTSSYKFRMNFGNQMIQAFMVGKMVFNCNTLPLTTDHATIQRVALVPLPFWFQKRQTVVDSMLNWTRGGQSGPLNDYERNFRRNISHILTGAERQFFIENRNTKNEDDLFNKPNETSLQLLNELSDQNARAPMFLVQNKTSQVYMLSAPPTGTIISGIVCITRYFCRFRFFNNIKEPVDYSVLPSVCNAAAQEWQRISQPYFAWKERYQVHKDSNVRTKVSAIHASLNHFAKNHAKNASFFDLRQFFEWDFAEHKIPYYNAKEDEYYVRIDPIQD